MSQFKVPASGSKVELAFPAVLSGLSPPDGTTFSGRTFNVQLILGPSIRPAEFSDCSFVLLWYRPILRRDGVSRTVMRSRSRIQIALMNSALAFPSIPVRHELDSFYFAMSRAEARTLGDLDVPAQKLKELESKMRPTERTMRLIVCSLSLPLPTYDFGVEPSWALLLRMQNVVRSRVPASGGKVNIALPNGTLSSFDIPAPGGKVTMSFAPTDVDMASPSGSKSAPMLFSSPYSLPYEQHQTVKYTLKPSPEVEPLVSSYVPLRYPSPEPDVQLVAPPAIPSELSHCGLVMYGYRIDEQQCHAMGFLDLVDASFGIGAGIDKLRISAFAKAADIPEHHKLEIFYFALCRKGAPVYTEDERGIPAEKMKELEGMLGLQPACWVSFDDIHKWED